jgi:hypothetical protein
LSPGGIGYVLPTVKKPPDDVIEKSAYHTGWNTCVSLPHIEGLELADDFHDEKFIVDVLIGADCALKFSRGECVHGNGPTTRLSNVGALLVG